MGLGTHTVLEIDRYPECISDNIFSPDIALLKVSGTLPEKVSIASSASALSLRIGSPIAPIGYPGELEEVVYRPTATFKDGTSRAPG